MLLLVNGINCIFESFYLEYFNVIHSANIVIFNPRFEKTSQLCCHLNTVTDTVPKKIYIGWTCYMCSLRLMHANNRQDGEIGAGMYTHI